MTVINQDVMQGQWRFMRGYVHRRWGDLTDSDLDRIQGRTDELTGLLQKKYGYTKEQAQQQVEYVIEKFEDGKTQFGGSRRTPLLIVAALLMLGVTITVFLRRIA